MYEFAITNGVGRLIDYGVCGAVELKRLRESMLQGEIMLFGYCGKDCETGQ